MLILDALGKEDAVLDDGRDDDAYETPLKTKKHKQKEKKTRIKKF